MFFLKKIMVWNDATYCWWQEIPLELQTHIDILSIQQDS